MDQAALSLPKKRPARHFSLEDKRQILNIFTAYEEENPKNAKTDNVELTAKAAGVSVPSVFKIIREYKKTRELHPPKVYRRQRAILDNIDDRTKSGLRRLINSLLERNEPPTLDKILAAVHEDEQLPQLKRTTLGKLIKEMGFRTQPSTSTSVPSTADPFRELEEPSCRVTAKEKPTNQHGKDKLYCRLCLKPANKNTSTSLSMFDFNYSEKSDVFEQKKIEEVEEIYRMLECCLPFFDALTFNPIICTICLARLKNSYEFSNQCLKSQKLVERYAHMHGGTEKIIDLNELVESNFMLSHDEDSNDEEEVSTSNIPKKTRSSVRISKQPQYSTEYPPPEKKQKFDSKWEKEESPTNSNDETRIQLESDDSSFLNMHLPHNMQQSDITDSEFIDCPDFIKTEPADDLHMENEIFNKRTGIGTVSEGQHSQFHGIENESLDTKYVPLFSEEPVFTNDGSSLQAIR